MRPVGRQTKIFADDVTENNELTGRNDKVFSIMMKLGFTTEQSEKFSEYAAMLIETNRHLNLTRITDEEDMVYSHFIDSIAPVVQGIIKDGDSILDVGTGAGFPAIPIAIMCPNSRITTVESVGKKVDFVDKVVDKLGINVDNLNKRVEELSTNRKMRGSYDVVVSRAVANMSVLLELTGAFAKVGGKVIAYKGKGYIDEVPAAENAAVLMGLASPSIYDVELRDDIIHYLVVYDKQFNTTAEFPRRYALIKKNPL